MTPAARAFALVMVAMDDDIQATKIQAAARGSKEADPFIEGGNFYDEANKIHSWIYGNAKALPPIPPQLTAEQINQARADRLALPAAFAVTRGLPAIGNGLALGQEAITEVTVATFMEYSVHVKVEILPEQLMIPQLSGLAGSICSSGSASSFTPSAECFSSSNAATTVNSSSSVSSPSSDSISTSIGIMRNLDYYPPSKNSSNKESKMRRWV